ncbi:uncharacterized protein LOC133200527 [Saccostrea echinata]|uniref:uncharacterized protein LOC133200527 n=1 Tax=Saccostrea echinata TaxID=191078 RepID=UPI002A83197B|nr:uncharacterized protein LOC133200527 [Saccostrea echinata]
MPLTKVTPRKPGFLCSICLLRLPSEEEWRDHLLACGMADNNRRKYECELCDQAFSKKIILTRHVKRLHKEQEISELQEKRQIRDSAVESLIEEDWLEDPGELIFEETNIELGRTQKKRTAPRLPGIKRKTTDRVNQVVEEEIIKDKDANEDEATRSRPDQEAPVENLHCSCCKKQVETVEVATQANIHVEEVNQRRHKKIIRVIRKYQENGETIEKFEEDIWSD